ncbi:MAG: efflux RND transporter periplasmic adaptor subunit [Betaproteobacteria bacterium]
MQRYDVFVAADFTSAAVSTRRGTQERMAHDGLPSSDLLTHAAAATSRTRRTWHSQLRVAFLALPLLALAACQKPADQHSEVRSVHAITVALAPDDEAASYTGDVRARWESALGFQVGGKIVARLVEVGTEVKVGQTLARLDPQDQRLGVEAARQQMIAAKSDYDQATIDLGRYKNLVAKGFVSKAEYDRRKSVFDSAAAHLQEASAQLSLSRNKTDYTTLRSDAAGVVTSVQAEAGQVVTAGQTVVKVARLDEREVAVSVPENRLAELKTADRVHITLWAMPGKTYDGRVREVSPSADAATRTYTVKVTLLNADAAVQLGMTANVLLDGNAGVQQVARLPLTALFQEGNAPAVWVIDPASGKVTLRPVQVGRYTQDYVTIVAGLASGDRVVRAGVHKLNPGETVKVIADATP